MASPIGSLTPLMLPRDSIMDDSPSSKRRKTEEIASFSTPQAEFPACPVTKPHITTPEYFVQQRENIEKWTKSSDLCNPPPEVVLRERTVVRVIRQIIGGKRHNALPMVGALCEKYPELDDIRSFINQALDSSSFTQLSSLCHELTARIDRSRAPEEAKLWAKFFQRLAGYQILQRKHEQLTSTLEYSRTREIPRFLDMLSNLVSRPIRAIQEITERTATPLESFFEMMGSMSHILKVEMDRLHVEAKPAIAKMFEKAFHSTREAVLGSRVLEVSNSLSVWGSARSLPAYDILAFDFSNYAADLGFSIKTGGGPGSMDAALAGGFNSVRGKLLDGKIPTQETFGLVGNFVKLNEKPSYYMTYRVDHHDLDIRKLLLRSNSLILVLPGRLGTDEELYAALVEIITDYYNTAERSPNDVSTVVLIGQYQRDLLLRHIVAETKKTENAHLLTKNGTPIPLFYFISADTQKLVAEYATATQGATLKAGDERLGELVDQREAIHEWEGFTGSEYNRVLGVVNTLLDAYFDRGYQERVAAFESIEGLTSSVELRTLYEKDPVVRLSDIQAILSRQVAKGSGESAHALEAFKTAVLNNINEVVSAEIKGNNIPVTNRPH